MILMTGATGRVGSRLLPRLVQDGWSVRALVRDMKAAPNIEAAGAVPVLGDLRDADAVRAALEGIDAVVHAAAAFRGVDPREAEEVNNTATLDLARAAARAGVSRFLFLSTNLVYGAGYGRPALEDDNLRESAPPYPKSKIFAEAGLRDVAQANGLGVRVLRLAFVYGDGDPHLRESLGWVKDWAGHDRLHLLHHADVANAVKRVLRLPDGVSRTYNVADDAPATRRELYEINRVTYAENGAGDSPRDPWNGIVSVVRARDELGFSPIYPTVHAALRSGAL